MPTKNVPSDSPAVSLRRWRVIEVENPAGVRSRHVWGHDETNSVGRASSPIKEFDLESMTAITRSGKAYRLVGLPGNSRLGKSAWSQWCSDNGIVAELDVTAEYLNVDQLSTVGFERIKRTVRR